ncbi:MAG: HD domain-containing protein [Desulfuromonadaceae bacterium]|nr:HD domain-containing protein [Desulfuromonadaceae bacterium]MDD2854685.1 HD domain-containing protein [Desulfuromonadaceae bacterium]
MEAPEIFIPISLESIEPVIFPDVALYIKTGSNHVLYKSHGRDFSYHDHERLSNNGVEFVFVSKDDMDVITSHMEESAERLLKSDILNSRAKGKMIYQTSINFVDDMFSNPDKTTDLERTKRLIENLMLYLSENPDAIGSLETVMSHNYHTFVHSLQVTSLTLMMHSEAYTLSRDEMLDVGSGAILHDFGKIFVPPEILGKNGKLNDSEIEILKRHPEDGYTFLKNKGVLSPVSLTIVRLHHERCNGSGYPLGLEYRDIPRSAQITGVADIYCTLTTDNQGNKTIPPHIAVQLMRNQMKELFAPNLLDTLEKLVCTEEVQQFIL